MYHKRQCLENRELRWTKIAHQRAITFCYGEKELDTEGTAKKENDKLEPKTKELENTAPDRIDKNQLGYGGNTLNQCF